MLGVELKPQAVTDTNTKSNLGLRVPEHAKNGEKKRRGKGTDIFPGFLLALLKTANVHTLIMLTDLLAKRKDRHLPAEHPQHQVENKEGAKQDKADKVDPGPFVPNGIIYLARREADEAS